MKDKVSASFASDRSWHSRRPLFICVYNTTKSATLSSRPPWNMITPFPSFLKTGLLLGFSAFSIRTVTVPCRRDVYIYGLLFSVSPALLSAQSCSSAACFFYFILFYLFFCFYFRDSLRSRMACTTVGFGVTQSIRMISIG